MVELYDLPMVIRKVRPLSFRAKDNKNSPIYPKVLQHAASTGININHQREWE